MAPRNYDEGLDRTPPKEPTPPEVPEAPAPIQGPPTFNEGLDRTPPGIPDYPGGSFGEGLDQEPPSTARRWQEGVDREPPPAAKRWREGVDKTPPPKPALKERGKLLIPPPPPPSREIQFPELWEGHLRESPHIMATSRKPLRLTGATTDVRTAIAAYLKTETTQTEGRVFRPELPKTEDEHMPRACIVVFSGGGGAMMGKDRLEAFDSLVDLACYASTRLEAENIADEAQYALRVLGRQLWEGVLLHWARISGGVKSAVDKETLWPFAIITTQVLHSFP